MLRALATCLLLVVGCGSREQVVPDLGLILLDIPAPAAEPVPLRVQASFRIQWVRDWDTLYYVIEVQDVVVTIEEARDLGIPDDLFLWALTIPATHWVKIFMPRRMSV